MLDTGEQRHPRPSYPSETVLVSIVGEAGWAPETVCTGMEKKKLFVHSGDLTSNRLSCSKWYTTLPRGPKKIKLVLSYKVRMKDSSCSGNREIVIYDILGFHAA